MTVIAVSAHRVKLADSHPCDAHGNLGHVWEIGKVDDLVVFPDSHNARARVGGTVIVAVYTGYTPAPSSQARWEQIKDLVCEECGLTFMTSQGLGNHRATQHQRKVGK